MANSTVDPFVRALLRNSAARQRVLELLSGPESVDERARLLRADLRLLRAESSLPRLTASDAVTLVRAFDDIRANHPDALAQLSGEQAADLLLPHPAVVFVS